MLKILTLNTWQQFGPWRERWELIFGALSEYKPDIAAFQEVFDMPHAEAIKERMGYPHLVKSGRHSGLIFVSKYAPLSSECLTLSQSPEENYRRYILFTLFDVKGMKLAGFNTHLSWKIHDDESRIRQTRELLAFTARKKRRFIWSYPAFMCGDFNAAPNKPSVQAVQKAWDDTYMKLHPGDAGLTWDYRNPFAERARDHMPERRIDYLFAQGLKPVRSEIVFNQPGKDGIYPSDHFGVMTEFAL